MNLITREELRSLRIDNIPDALEGLDPSDEIVVYCASVNCPASIYAYRALEQLGHRRVHRYAGGVADWEQAGFAMEAAVRLS